MARYKTGNSVKDRRNRPCDGFRNWDTAAACVVLRHDRKCHEYAAKNADRLLRMKKDEKLRALERNSGYGFGGVSYRNVDFRELNAELKKIKKNK